MPIDVKQAQKPIRKLRKFLKKWPKRPSPDDVHDLRTNSRRLEAELAALGLETRKNERRVLRAMQPIRKRAGKIRDMDVLTDYAAGVRVDGEANCLVQLLEYLGTERDKQAKKLCGVMQRKASPLRLRQKRSLRHVKKRLRNADLIQLGDATPAAPREAMASALQLSSELSVPTRLDRKNLHPYRLKVKELRYVLQLASDSEHEQFVEKLGEVKDAIGEWHDWEELIAIAESVLDHGADCRLLRKLRTIGNDKYEHALSVTNEMRERYLRPASSMDGAGKNAVLSRPVLDAITAIAA